METIGGREEDEFEIYFRDRTKCFMDLGFGLEGLRKKRINKCLFPEKRKMAIGKIKQ